MKNCRQEDSGECETNMMGPPRYDVESQSHKNIIIHKRTLRLLKRKGRDEPFLWIFVFTYFVKNIFLLISFIYI
jgi:hypothetical protein